MGSRGRTSAAALSVANVAENHRLAPPHELTEAQRGIWLSVVNARPADWFSDEHTGLLLQYCRHRVQADVIAGQLECFDPGWLSDDDGLKRYDKLSAMLERETRAINALLRSMRLTQQSLVRADKAIPSESSKKKPWEN